MAVNKKTTATATTKDKSIESWIWDAACSIRGAKDAPKYKDFILPLIFTKRLCDVFDDELNRIAGEVGPLRRLPTQEVCSPSPASSHAQKAFHITIQM